jgi:hypothetical protein
MPPPLPVLVVDDVVLEPVDVVVELVEPLVVLPVLVEAVVDPELVVAGPPASPVLVVLGAPPDPPAPPEPPSPQPAPIAKRERADANAREKEARCFMCETLV